MPRYHSDRYVPTTPTRPKCDKWNCDYPAEPGRLWCYWHDPQVSQEDKDRRCDLELKAERRRKK